MSAFDCDVAIVGAGPTGLTLANLLGQAGIRVVLVERNEGTVREPRAVTIDDESLRTMQAIGLVDIALRDIAPDIGTHYFGPAGHCFVKVEPATREYGYARRNAFSQPLLEATLREGLARFPSVEALFQTACETVAEDADGVTLTLSGASPRTVRARYLVACDGARSAIRKHIGATLAGATYQQRWLIVDLGASHERLRQTRVVCDPDRPLITLSGPGGTRRYEFMLRDGESDEAVTEPSFIRNLLLAHGPDADAPIIRRQVYAFHARIVDRWNTARIYLAGDAAHLSPPFAGQGMNSGVRDAHNLGWKLAAVIHGELGEGLLATYQSERAPHARALIDLAVNIGRVMTPASHRQAALVRFGFQAARLVPGLAAYFAQMKYKPKPFYRAGFVAPDDSGLNIVGRMLPQPLVERPDRSQTLLDHALGEGFRVLVYGPGAQHSALALGVLEMGPLRLTPLAVLPSFSNPDFRLVDLVETVRDQSGGFGAMLPGDRETLLLVRPDRTVAAAAPAGADFGAMLRRLAALPQS